MQLATSSISQRHLCGKIKYKLVTIGKKNKNSKELNNTRYLSFLLPEDFTHFFNKNNLSIVHPFVNSKIKLCGQKYLT